MMKKKWNFSKKLKKRVFTEENQIDAGLSFSQYLLCDISNNTLVIPFKTVTKEKNVKTQAIINCGAGGAFIDQNFEQKKSDYPLTAKNVDGTINKKGTIKKYMDLEFKINSRKFREQFYVTGLGKQKIILGFPWLQKHNPKID